MEPHTRETGLRLVAGLLAAAWLVAILSLGFAASTNTSMLDAATVLSLLSGILAFVGAVLTLFFKRSGVYIYVAANLMMLAKSIIFAGTGTVLGNFWFLALLALYLAAVAMSWDRFRGNSDGHK